MNTQEQIKRYITSQPEPKRSDMQALHRIILQVMPVHKLWFLDGKNSENKTVSNPNIGYGLYTIKYADGKTRDFYQVGMSANQAGISIYILGIEDKKYLASPHRLRGRTAYGKLPRRSPSSAIVAGARPSRRPRLPPSRSTTWPRRRAAALTSVILSATSLTHPVLAVA